MELCVNRSRIHERTISLRSLFNEEGGEGNPLVELSVNSKEDKSFVPITSKNSASGENEGKLQE
jgi:hypothetical protein